VAKTPEVMSDRNSYNLRQKLELLRSQLENERVTFLPQWRDLADFILPRRSRFFVTDTNKGDRRNLKILDSTATMAARTMRAGMMSGVTSPARPWFKLSLADPELAEQSDVKRWLDYVSNRMGTSFLRSNLYNVLPTVYGDLGNFGTGCMLIEEDFDGDIMRCYPFPIGSYMISQNEKLKVDTFYREFRMTVRQVVAKFGMMPDGKIDWSKFSQHVKNMYDQNLLEAWVDVAHCIMPNADYDARKPLSKFKKFISIYYERGQLGSGTVYLTDIDNNVYLSIKGYDYFPVLAPRWEVTGEDVYGTDCPGMVALGDVKQLQTGEKRALQAIEKMINPPMTGPTSLRNSKASILPGDITYVDNRDGQSGFRAAHEINFNLQALEVKQEQVRSRIQRAFFEDLFLMLAQSDRRQITAREIEERHEEKLLALGPVLEQLNQDLLDPLIDIAFDFHVRQGLIPPPPEALQGMELKVEYISIMAQAQKLVGIGAVERFAGFVGQMAQFNPDVMDKLDMDQAIDVYGDITSVPVSIIRTDEAVAEIRATRAQAAQQQKQMEMMSQGASAARDLSQAKLTDDSALSALLSGPEAGAIV